MAPTTMLGSSNCSQSRPIERSAHDPGVVRAQDRRTLFAGFDFSFSKIFWDCSFVAMAAMLGRFVQTWIQHSVWVILESLWAGG